jgi:hypothetical protein
MNTPNTTESNKIEKIEELIPYEYEMEHTHMEFICISSAAFISKDPFSQGIIHESKKKEVLKETAHTHTAHSTHTHPHSTHTHVQTQTHPPTHPSVHRDRLDRKR